MKVIALEEHYVNPIVEQALRKAGFAVPVENPALAKKLNDLGIERIAEMDAAGIDMQVLSLSRIENVDKLLPTEGTALVRECNDMLADAVSKHPDRFTAFAMLAMQEPEGAAAELERCVTALGFKGVVINGTINGLFLDNPRFYPILAVAEKLKVPIYLHPAPPPPGIFDIYFSGLPENVGVRLATAGWGWHAETALHSLRLITAGVFDRFPNLQIIMGHMGENIPFSLARADDIMTKVSIHLQRRVGEYFLSNFQVTTSGYFTYPPLLCALSVFGADRIMFAVDYPFSSITAGKDFLAGVPLNPTDMEKFTHANAERLLRL